MTDSQPLKIFITHSWRDIKFARRLYNDLKTQGFEVWFDDKTLQAGHRMAEEINRGLAWCDVYIPIMSHAAIASEWCWEEINAAITLSNQPGRNKRPRIVSVLVENCVDEMPPSLVARLYISFAGRYEDAVQELGEKGFGIDIAERERIAREKAEAERVAREKAKQTRRARKKAKSKRAAQNKEVQERLVPEKTEAARVVLEKIEHEKEKGEKGRSEPAALKQEDEEFPVSKKIDAEHIARAEGEQEQPTRGQVETELLVPEEVQTRQPSEKSPMHLEPLVELELPTQTTPRSVPVGRIVVGIASTVVVFLIVGSLLFTAVWIPAVATLPTSTETFTPISGLFLGTPGSGGTLPKSGLGEDLLLLAGGIVLVLIIVAARRARETH